MKWVFGEDCCGWVAEDDQDREALRILQARADEIRIEHGPRMFRDYQITIYLPTRQPPERVMDTKAPSRRRSDIANEMMRLIKEDDRRSD